jgi:KUP system potassium uptake protein
MTETLQTAGLPRQGVRKQTAAAALTALGVVYGDIGTSTLYGLKQAVEAAGGAHPRHSDGRRVADPLGAPPDRRAQIRNSDLAGR